MSGKKRATDSDAPALTADGFAEARPAAQALPERVLAAARRGPGRPKSDAAKVAVKLRLDPDLLEALRATGEGWQTRVNDTLRATLRLAGQLR